MTGKQALTLALLVWNVLVFLTYGLDKGRARQGAYRISEKTLLLQTLVGGGLGALCAGYAFRHKTRKWYFTAAWLLGFGLDVALLYWIWR